MTAAGTQDFRGTAPGLHSCLGRPQEAGDEAHKIALLSLVFGRDTIHGNGESGLAEA